MAAAVFNLVDTNHSSPLRGRLRLGMTNPAGGFPTGITNERAPRQSVFVHLYPSRMTKVVVQ
jgi:hypothetical protein